MGRPEDKAGRQLAAFVDLNDLDRNRQEHALQKERQSAADRAAAYAAWKRAKGAGGSDAADRKRKHKWLYED